MTLYFFVFCFACVVVPGSQINSSITCKKRAQSYCNIHAIIYVIDHFCGHYLRFSEKKDPIGAEACQICVQQKDLPEEKVKTSSWPQRASAVEGDLQSVHSLQRWKRVCCCPQTAKGTFPWCSPKL